MNWVFYALLAPFIWASCNMIDKYLISKRIKFSSVYILMIGFISLIAAVFLIIVKGLNVTSYPSIFVAMVAGAIYSYSIWLYFEALKIEEVSKKGSGETLFYF